MIKKQKGFTLIELLVVIAIIGILSTLAVISLNNARMKSRDAKRVADVKQVQTALELYFNDLGGYPVYTGLVMGGTNAKTLSSLPTDARTGFSDAPGGTTYMGQVPVAPTPPAGDTYTYSASSTSDYAVTFNLEGQTGALIAGPHTATPAGIQ